MNTSVVILKCVFSVIVQSPFMPVSFDLPHVDTPVQRLQKNVEVGESLRNLSIVLGMIGDFGGDNSSYLSSSLWGWSAKREYVLGSDGRWYSARLYP